MTWLQIVYQLTVLLTGLTGLTTGVIAIRKKHKPNATDVLVKSGDQAVTTLQRVITTIETENIRLNKKVDSLEIEMAEKDSKIQQLASQLAECQKKIGERIGRLRTDVEDVKAKIKGAHEVA